MATTPNPPNPRTPAKPSTPSKPVPPVTVPPTDAPRPPRIITEPDVLEPHDDGDKRDTPRD